MQERFMQVFYGTDRLPYKDSAREVHYPVISSTSGGNLIIGENNTTKILFYVGLIGGSNAQWIANIKKPDGTLSYQLCSNPHSDGDDYVVELDISSLYTNLIGDVYIAIQGYSGETEITEDDGVYSISGDPIILSTGTIKIKVNYAPSVLPKGETLSPTVEQQILASFSDYLLKSGGEMSGDISFQDGKGVKQENGKNIIRKVSNDQEQEDQLLIGNDYIETAKIELHSGEWKFGEELLNQADEVMSTENYVRQQVATKSNVSVSSSGTSIDEVQYITIDGVEKKLAGGQSTQYSFTNGVSESDGVVSADTSYIGNAIGIDDKEDSDNKKTTLANADNDTYPTTLAVANELQDIREVAEGKCKTFIVSYQETTVYPQDYVRYSKLVNGEVVGFSSQEELQEWLDETWHGGAITRENKNSLFNSQSDFTFAPLDYEYIIIENAEYKKLLATGNEFSNYAKTGDIILVEELNVPDRWYNLNNYYMNILETTKTDISTKVDKVATTDKIYGTDNHGDQTTYDNSSFVHTSGDETIGGNKSFNDNLYTKLLRPISDNLSDLGASSFRYKDLYLSGVLSDGTNSVSVANIADKSAQNTVFDYTSGDTTLKIGHDNAKSKLSFAGQSDTREITLERSGYDLLFKEQNEGTYLSFGGMNGLKAYKSLLADSTSVHIGSTSNPFGNFYGKDIVLIPTVHSGTTFSDSITNGYHQFSDSLTSLAITGLTGDNGQYELHFIAGANLSVSLPSGVSWADGQPTFTQGNEYRIIIKPKLTANTYSAFLIEEM